MVAVRLGPFQNIVNVGWSTGMVGVIEMVLWPPIPDQKDPTGHPTPWGFFSQPARDEPLRAMQGMSDPPVSPHPSTQRAIPPQDHFDSVFAVSVGAMFGSGSSDEAGAGNWMINWDRIREPEFWSIPEIPTEGLDDLKFRVHGIWNDAFATGDPFPPLWVELRFTLYRTGKMSDFQIDSTYGFITSSAEVVVAAEPVTRAFTAAAFGGPFPPSEYLATLVFEWNRDSTEPQGASFITE